MREDIFRDNMLTGAIIDRVADKADCVVISVDYHLAPEAEFPEGLEDSYKAVVWGRCIC